MFFSVALLVRGWGSECWGEKSYLGSAQISSFFSWDLSWGNKHDSFWLVLTGYLYWILILDIFLPFEIHRRLVLPLSSISFTANSQADNHFYKYIYFFLNIIQYEIRYTLKFFIFKFNLNVKMFYRKKYRKNKFFFVDYVKTNELHVVHTPCHMQSE